jgi:hypothetical protein
MTASHRRAGVSLLSAANCGKAHEISGISRTESDRRPGCFGEEGIMRRKKKFDTTLGDLIVALTEEAGRYVGDEREKYHVVALLLAGLLRNSTLP